MALLVFLSNDLVEHFGPARCPIRDSVTGNFVYV